MYDLPSARIRSDLRGALCGLSAALVVLLLSLIQCITSAMLICGLGPAVVAALVLALLLQRVKVGWWRAGAALLLSVPAFLGAFAVFGYTMSLAHDHRLEASSLISDLGLDVAVALAAAVVAAAIGFELLAWLLLGRASPVHTGLLCVAGELVVVVMAAIARFRFQLAPEDQLWLFFDPLYLVGGALFTAIVNDQAWLIHSRSVASTNEVSA